MDNDIEIRSYHSLEQEEQPVLNRQVSLTSINRSQLDEASYIVRNELVMKKISTSTIKYGAGSLWLLACALLP